MKPEPENSIMLPPFVQIETLHPGQTFVSLAGARQNHLNENEPSEDLD